jgi:hypothetical protein
MKNVTVLNKKNNLQQVLFQSRDSVRNNDNNNINNNNNNIKNTRLYLTRECI